MSFEHEGGGGKVRKRFVLLIVLSFLLFSFSALGSLKNGDFEKSDLNSWSFKNGESKAISLDTSQFKTGRSSLKIVHINEESFSWAWQETNVRAHSTYILTGFIRTAGIIAEGTENGARIFVGDKFGRKLGATEYTIGTNSWQKFEVKFDTNNLTSVSIIPQLHKAQGSVWFDSFELKFVEASAEYLHRNLVVNGDFEQVIGDPLIAQGWTIPGANRVGAVTIDSGAPKGGKYSIRIENQDEDEYNRIFQHVEVEPNTNYVLSYWIKGEEIVKGQGGISAKVFCPGANITGKNGTFEWEYISVVFNSGNNKKLELVPYLHKSSGTVWYDNIEIRLAEKKTLDIRIANLVANGSFEQVSGTPLEAEAWRQPSANTKGSITIDSKSIKDGKYSLRIENKQEDEYNRVFQQLIIEPNKDYVLSFWVKGDNIVKGPDGYGARIYFPGVVMSGREGTFDWEFVSIPFNSGERTKVEFSPYLHLSSGTVWYDEIEVRPAEKTILETKKTNLVQNGSFDLTSGSPLQAQGWRKSASSESSITLDPANVKDGKYSLMIENKHDGEYNRVFQQLNLEPYTDYVLNFWIKGENIIKGPGGYGARIYLQGVSVSGKDGTFDWEYISVPFNSGERTKVDFSPYLHLSSGTVWYDGIEVRAIDPSEKEPGLPLQMSNYIYSGMYYSPETGLETTNYLRVNSVLSTREATSVRFNLYTIHQSSGGFELPSERPVNPWINYLSIRLNGQVLPFLEPLQMSLGYNAIRFSPYIATLNTDYSVRGQGVLVQSLKIKKTELSGFIVWERKTPYRDVGEGLRMRFSLGPWKTNLVFIRFLSGNPVVENGKIRSLGKYELIESDSQIELERRFNNGISLKALQVRQNKKAHIIPLVTAENLDLEIPIGKHKIAFSYRDFDDSLTPRYRDKQPKFNSDGRILGWNPIERYNNQQGWSAGVFGPLWGRAFNFQVDSYKLKPELFVRKTNYLASIGGKTSLDLIASFDNTEDEAKYLQFLLQHNIERVPWANIVGKVSFAHDRTGENNDLGAQGLIKDFGMKFAFKKGFLTRLSLSFGLQNAQKWYQYIKGEWILVGNIQLSFSFRNPNVLENKGLRMDEYDRFYYRDNYISLKSVVSF